jgi:isocitrate dehydrogenase
MITLAEAERIARDYLNKRQENDAPVTLVTKETVTKEYGWVFAYQSDEFLQTGNFSYALAGNGPLLVLKNDGTVIEFGTAYPMEWYLREFEGRAAHNK